MSRRILWPALTIGLLLGGAGWYWFRPELLFLDRKVHEAFADSGAAPLVAGQFRGVAHETRGRATIYRTPSGELLLRLSGFATSNGPDLVVYLVAAPDAADNRTVTESEFVSLGTLKGNVGEQSYQVPAALDLGRYRAVTIWCRRFSVNFGTAPLTPAVPAR